MELKEAGFQLGLLAGGVHPNSAEEISSFNEALSASGESLHQAMAKVAVCLYEEVGEGDAWGAMVFQKIASSPWNPGYSVFTDAVFRVLGRDALEKTAAMPGLWSLIKAGPASAALLSRAGVLGTVAAGAAGGALYNAASRGVTQDGVANKELQARRDHYRKLVDELKDEIQYDLRRGLKTPDESVARVLQTYGIEAK